MEMERSKVESAKQLLIEAWEEQIANGWMSRAEMAKSLQNQLDGVLDLSLDELDLPMAEAMGWDSCEDLTEEQAEEWTKVDHEACREWLAKWAVERIAEANPKAVSKDLDALLELGEVDAETVWAGYLADAIVEELGDSYEAMAEFVDSAIIDFYCDQFDSILFDEEDWDEDEDI